MQSNVKFKAALIGAGYICEYHVAALRRAGIEIVGVSDLDVARAGAIAEKFGLRVLGSLDEAAGAGADVIHVLTPPDSHAKITLRALELGRHVLVEKPLAVDVEDCRRIQQAADAAGKSVCVNHSLLFDPQICKALGAAKSGKLGKIVGVDIFRSSMYPPFGPGPVPPQYRNAGYPFRDLGIHALYLLEAFLGDIENVTADWRSLGGDPNLAYDDWRAQVRCRGGVGQVHLSWNVRPLQNQMIIQGTKGILRVDLFAMFQTKRGNLPVPKAAERVLNAMAESVKPMIDVPIGVGAFLTKRALPYHGLQDLVAAFYESLQKGEPAPVTPQQAIAPVDWTERIARAADAQYAQLVAPLTLSDQVPVLVTGASGGLGSAVVDKLLETGQRVRILVRRPPAVIPKNVEVALGDLGDAGAVDRAVKGASLVIHCGAAMKGPWLEHERGTVVGTQNVIDACLKHRVVKLVHISSMSVVDWAGLNEQVVDENSPLEPHADWRGNYTRAKLEAEQAVSRAVRDHGLPAVILRPGQIFGGKIPLLTGAVARNVGGRWLVLGDGNLRLPLIHMDDVVDAIFKSASADIRSGEIIQLVNDRQPTQNEVLRHVLPADARIWRLARSVVFALGGFSEMMLGMLKRQSPLSRYRLRSALSHLRFRSVHTYLLPGWYCKVDVLGREAVTPPEPSEAAPKTMIQAVAR
jgi:predicted dehydrogenase/nucleoside-diphosphate-sugar epimerase